MIEPINPLDEFERQAELCALQVLDTVAEERFDRVTRSAQRMFGVPIVLISLVDTDRQWFKSRQGLDAPETPRNISFCGHAILHDEVFVIENALADVRFADNPLVLGEPNIRFYAGVPLKGPHGHNIGTLCLICPVARTFDAADAAALEDLGKWAETELNFSTLREATELAERMAEELRVLNAQVSSAARLHQAILDGANYSIIASDVDGAICIFNVGAEHMLGYTAAEMMGQSPAVFHVSDEVVARANELTVELERVIEPGFESFVAKARSGIPDEHEWTYIRKDGSAFPVMLSVTALFDEHRVITGFLGIAYDLTERKRIEHLQAEFISTVSHELRTPLTSIRGSLGLLAGGAVGEIPERAKALLDIAKNNCERLVRLINDILDIEKIESGNMRFDISTQQLVPLVEQAIALTQAYAIQFQVQFVLRIESADSADSADSFDCYVAVDPDRLIQVIVNLLSNACKFSPVGGTVEINLTRLEKRVRLTVTDHGEGIPEAFRGRIFQKFAQADSSDTRVKGGTGLGLNISKKIIEKHQGRIDFTSERGVGTQFFVELPLAVAPLGVTSRHGQVLICEDDPDIAKLLGLMLAQEGYTSDVADNAGSARKMLLAGQYDAMTLDLALPGEDGISLLHWMRSQEHTRVLPVVVVSANADARGAMNGGAVGIIDWLTKPIDQDRLLVALNKLTKQSTTALPCILHVDDDMDLVAVVAALLQPGMTVVHAATLAEAQIKLNEQDFSLILLDLSLPDGNGADLLASLPRRNVATPVVIFSAQDANRNILDKVRGALVKSRVSNEQLLETLHYLVNSLRLNRHIGE